MNISLLDFEVLEVSTKEENGQSTGVVISRGNNNATFTVKDYDYTYSGTSYNLQTNVKVNFNELYIAVARGAGPSAAAAVELFRISSVVGLIRSITNY